MFGRDWDKAEATIVDRTSKFTADGSVVVHTFLADVRLTSGETFRATIHEPTIATDFWAPSIRDVVSVLVRPKDRKVKFDKDDERLSVKAYEAGRKAAFEAAAQQPALTQPASAAAPTASPELPEAIAAKLAQLGFPSGTPMNVVSADSPAGQAALSALNHTAHPVQTPEARLLQLQSLHERGLLTDAEYAEQRHRILDEL